MEEPRVGVFVCHCGINIAAYVDVPSVVEYARSLPGVVHAERNLFTCSEEGISAIKRGIGEHGLNRVVVASCTPRTHEPLFRAACEEVGLNKYLFEFVNIRDQCSWVHMRHPEEATAKAKDLVRMGVAKARLLEPLEEIEIPVLPSALVLGGGVAGMSAALNLAGQGFEVHLVEKEKELGGTLLSLNKLLPGNIEAGELVNPLVQKVMEHGKISTYLSTTARGIGGFIGNFEATLEGKGEESTVKAGTVIVATGAQVLKPQGAYGYGQLPNVITQLELEGKLKRGEDIGQNVVMINCVGARIPERSYCSRICCMTAIKNSCLIKEAIPGAKVWVLHRDIMAYGVDFEEAYHRAMELGVRFIRYDPERPPEIGGTGKADKVKVWHQLMGREIELPADAVVLTTPMLPGADNEEISRMLKVPLGSQGFFLEAHLKLMPVEFATNGIYICGAARWPTTAPEAITQAQAAASKAAAPLRRGFVKPEANTSWVNERVCSGCGFCEVVCPYKAIEMQINKNGRTVSHVNVAICKGCGTCAAACTSGAITMNHFTDSEILAQIEAMVG